MIKSIINECHKPITAYIGSKQVWQNEWTPSQLFKNGEQGVWYDPSDLSTMYQNATSTTPVTTDGDPAGLILDKSKGLELGAEILPNTDFSDGWSFTNNKDNTVTNNTVSLSPVVGYNAIVSYSMPAYTLTAGKLYKVQCRVLATDVAAYTARMQMVVSNPYEAIPMMSSTTQDGILTGYFKITNSASAVAFRMTNADNKGLIQFSEPSLREIKSNPATQSTASARPIYRTDGELHWLGFDGVDDTLSAQLPSGTYTEIKASRDGVTHKYPVNINGSYALGDLTQTKQSVSGLVLVNRQLTQTEIENVTNLMKVKAGLPL